MGTYEGLPVQSGHQPSGLWDSLVVSRVRRGTWPDQPFTRVTQVQQNRRGTGEEEIRTRRDWSGSSYNNMPHFSGCAVQIVTQTLNCGLQGSGWFGLCLPGSQLFIPLCSLHLLSLSPLFSKHVRLPLMTSETLQLLFPCLDRFHTSHHSGLSSIIYPQRGL